MQMLSFDPRRSISHLLIVICIIVSIAWFGIEWLIDRYGFHRIFINSGDIAEMIPQIVLFQFLHGSLLHLFLNAYFLYSAGPEVESRMSQSRYIQFFVTSTLFVAICLFFLSSPNSVTIGISGFCMALLSYLWIDLHTTRHPMANQILIMLVINILMGLSGNISFVGHAAGAVWGLIWWKFFRDRKKSWASFWR